MVETATSKLAAATISNQAGDKKPADPIIPPYVIHRSKAGLKLFKSFDQDKLEVCKTEQVLVNIESAAQSRIEAVCCSEDGEYLAWCDNTIKCIKLDNIETVLKVENTSKSNCVYISPKSTKLVTYNTMSGGENLHIWNLQTKEHLLAMPWKKATRWKPVFSMNEELCIQHTDSQLAIYTGGNFDKPKRIGHMKVDDFSLSTSSMHSSTYQHLYAKRIRNKTHHVAIYTAGAKGQPSIVKIYRYPNLKDCITNKSFFRADSVKFLWSPSGNSLLLTCQADFDKAGKSYYGEQSLNYLNIKSDSYFVKLPKEGTISHIEWFPSVEKDMFVCVYGLMPAKVSLFNDKCEVIFNFGDEGSFNGTAFSPYGNIIAVYGFGNLSGQLCIWDFDKKKLLSTIRVPETTLLEWCADGRHLITCTTTPRLRVNNGFRIWHFNGALLHEQICTDSSQLTEIYDIFWQQRPNQYKKPKCDNRPSPYTNILNNSKLQKFQGSSVTKYVPPHLRRT